jgi:general secretion pathway protein F
MAAFAYKAVTQEGRLETGELEAADAEAVLRILDRRGLIPVSVDERKAGTRESAARRLSVSAPQVTRFLSDLSIMVNAGIRVDEALSIMEREFDNGRLRPVVSRLRGELANGRSFSQALEDWPRLFPPFQVAMIRIAERAGRLPVLLARVAEERQRFEGLAAKVSEALRYPAFLLAGVVAVMIFFLVGVVPQFEPVLAQTGQANGFVEIMFSVSRGVRNNRDLILAGAALLLLIGLLAGRRPGFRARLRKFVSRLPFLSDIATSYRTARFSRLMGIMVEAGVGVPAAIKLIGDAIDPADPDQRADRASDAVRQGRRIGEALEIMALPGLAVRMLRIGEESGDLSGLAYRAADVYEARLERQLSRLVGFIGPAAVIIISVLIGGMIVSIMSALMSFNELVR